MRNSPSPKGLPATTAPRSPARADHHAHHRSHDRRHDEPEDAEFVDATDYPDPEVETVIDASQIKEKIIDYLGAVLARCWFDHGLLEKIAQDPHKALREVGIFLPADIDVKVERENKSRPRLVIYEWNPTRSFRKRICYLQLIMMAGA